MKVAVALQGGVRTQSSHVAAHGWDSGCVLSEQSSRPRRERRAGERRDQLAACAEAVATTASFRQITPRIVRHDTPDGEIRKVLTAIIRLWTKMEPVRYVSKGILVTPDLKGTVEHMVPCRVLVDLLILRPERSREILEHGVILSRVTKDEHTQLGGIFVDHEDIYRQMLAAEPADLEPLALDRYRNSKVAIQSV